MFNILLLSACFHLIICNSFDDESNSPANLFQLLKYKQKVDQVPNFFKINNVANFNDLVMKTIRNLNVRNDDFDLNNECITHLSNFSQGLFSNEEWALKILDSLGKPPAGISNGAINWLGDYRQCVNESMGVFPRKYCYVSNTKIPFKYGICVSKACTYEDLYKLIYFTFEILQIQFDPDALTYLVCQDTKILDWKAILALSILGVLFTFVLISTIYDFYGKFILNNKKKTFPNDKIELKENKEIKSENKSIEQKESKIHQILVDSSIYSNTIKLFDLNESKEQFTCLNGIRFLSLSWVILGHTYSFIYSASDNASYYFELVQRFPFMIVLNGILSVDTFFLLSGFLTSYLFIKIISKTKLSTKFMVKYYIHRYLRITPVYMVVLMISATLTKYIGEGPIFPENGFELNQCNDTWYLNMLYMNNLIKKDRQCLGVSWYLANDMQYHWLAPLVLIPFALKKPIIGIVLSILTLLASIITTIIIINQNPGFELGNFGGNPDFFTNAYVVPWFRVGPFIVGLLLGYIIYRKKTSKSPNYIHPVFNILLWILSLFLLCLMVFGNYPNFSGNPMKKWMSIIYETFSKIIWSIGLSYIIYACVTGNGGFVNKFLSLKIWKPLAKLSFSIYLIHSIVLTQVISTGLRPIYIQDTLMMYRFIGNLTLSVIAGYFVYIFIELPFAAFEKNLLM